MTLGQNGFILYYRKLKMNKIKRKLAHHQRQARKWTDTAQRLDGVDTKWLTKAIRQANWHALQVTNLQAQLNGWK